MDSSSALALAVLASRIFLTSEHAASHRTAILEQDGGVAFLYVTVPGSLEPEGDIVVYSTGILATEAEALRAAQDGTPPPLTKDAATAEAVIRDATARDFSFRWSADGKGIALLRDGRPVAMLLPESKKYVGYSRALAKRCPFGRPWDDTLFRASFK
jgi:hypothetical protein